jgi:hypothetical protein
VKPATGAHLKERSATVQDIVIEILARGGGVRISCKGLLADTMKEYAEWAFKGKARLEFVVGDEQLLPEVMREIAAMGRGRVLFDFARPSRLKVALLKMECKTVTLIRDTVEISHDRIAP